MFLALPSFFAGVCLGLNNFLLGMISDKGISSAFIFSFGALMFAVIYRVRELILHKRKYGIFWNYQDSNLFVRKQDGTFQFNQTNVIGLILRASINMAF